MTQLLLKTGWQFLKKLKIELPYDPAIPLPGIYPEELKAGSQRGICTPIFTAALLTTAKARKQPKCLLRDEWISKMWYILMHTMDYYLVFERKEFLTYTITWMDLYTMVSLYHAGMK